MADFNDLFDDDYGYEPELEVNDLSDDTINDVQTEPQHTEEDLIGDLLKRQGISDPSKIKFEENDGIVKERDWDDLSYDEQLNILTGDGSYNPETDLDDDEIDMINSMRSSNLSPKEYLDMVKNSAINEYAQNSYLPVQNYSIDNYTDDELYLYDMQVRMPDMTDEELIESLENAKTNETVFKKLVNGIRNEYRLLEDNKIRLEQIVAAQLQQQQYNQYANMIINAIDNQSDIAGTFELEDDDKQNIAYSILGQDQAGISLLGKALNDPDTLVKMVWFALRGEEAIDGLNEYWKDQVSRAKQLGYQRGLDDAASGNTGSRVVRRTKLQQKQYKTIDDLD